MNVGNWYVALLLHTGNSRFKPWPADRLLWQKFFMVLCLSRWF